MGRSTNLVMPLTPKTRRLAQLNETSMLAFRLWASKWMSSPSSSLLHKAYDTTQRSRHTDVNMTIKPVDKLGFPPAVILAFAAVYLIWGSTYLAIQYAVDSLPPLASSSFRFFVAGLIMFAIAKLRREKKLPPAEAKTARLTGVLLISANAVVCVAEKKVNSGLAAVVIGAMPIWIMFLSWSFFLKERPSPKKLLGAVIGLIGIALITAGGSSPHHAQDYFFGVFLLLLSSALWSTGTLLQRHTRGVLSTFRFTGEQMLAGSLAVALLSFCGEDLRHFAWNEISLRSSLALLYLIVFGSVIGFTSYSWLSRRVEPHLVSTYALVNPVIAVALGWAFAGDLISGSFLGGVLLVLSGLALLIF
jgi:drug/metabolite transporter (DMT)-like permease